MPRHADSSNSANHEEQDEWISKTERKRQMEALQALGAELLELSDAELGKMTLPEKLIEGLDIAKRIRSREARRRQLQYIGKVMRDIDTSEIAAFLEDRRNGHKNAAKRFHALEALRDELIAQGDAAISKALEHFPQADRQKLRQLCRQAQKEQSQGKPPAAARKLFKYLRELQEQQS